MSESRLSLIESGGEFWLLEGDTIARSKRSSMQKAMQDLYSLVYPEAGGAQSFEEAIVEESRCHIEELQGQGATTVAHMGRSGFPDEQWLLIALSRCCEDKWAVFDLDEEDLEELGVNDPEHVMTVLDGEEPPRPSTIRSILSQPRGGI